MSLFFAIVLSLWAALHVYVVLRLVSPLGLRLRSRLLLSLPALSLMALAPTGLWLDDRLDVPYALWVRWLAWSYMGLFSTLAVLMLCRDAVWLVARSMRRLAGGAGREPPESAARRRFLINASSGGVLSATGALTWTGIGQARGPAEVVEVDVPIAGLPRELDGYHIVQISDIHVGETIDKDFILPLVETVTSLAPDLVAVTGDIVDGSVDALRADVSPLAYLRARDHVLCVTGNHEYYSGVEPWCAHFAQLGMKVLNNEHVLIERGGKRLLVAGVTDHREGQRHPGHRSDPARALRDAPPHDVRILLAHQPRSAFDAAPLGFALQLSGHTHGGQYFPFNLFVGMVQKPVARGLGRHGGMWVYVNRGSGYWGPPLRTFVPAEITSLRLRRA